MTKEYAEAFVLASYRAQVEGEWYISPRPYGFRKFRPHRLRIYNQGKRIS